jgi:hypothetical protein
MGAASVETRVVGCEQQTKPRTISNEASQTIDESHIQLTLAEVTPSPLSSAIESRIAPPALSTAHAEQLNNSPNAVDAENSRATKCTAEDAEFDGLAEIVPQVLPDLKHQIYDINEQIRLLQTQRRDLLVKKKDVKKRFTRQTMPVASRTNGQRYRD